MSLNPPHSRFNEVIFFGQIPAYIGSSSELTRKVFDFYISFREGNLTRAFSLFNQFPSLIKQNLQPVQDIHGTRLSLYLLRS